MKTLESALKLNVLIEMAVADPPFKHLLMCEPLVAAQEYNRRMTADSSLPCSLPRLEVEMLQRVGGVTTDFRQFCRLLIEERDRIERIEEQRRHMEVLVPSGINHYQPELVSDRRSA